MESEQGKPEKESEKQSSEDASFRLIIDDTFLPSNGPVITGKVQTGILHVGDEVQIISRNGHQWQAVAKSIEQFNKKVDMAVPDSYGFAILIGGLTNDYVRNLMNSGQWVDRGDFLCEVDTESLTSEEPFQKSDSLPISKSTQAREDTSDYKLRRGDGTILGISITNGTYKSEAGSEKIGYFDPSTAPFRTYSGGKTGLIMGKLADNVIDMILSVGIDNVRSVYGSMFDKTEDIAVDLAIKLGLSSTKQVVDIFQQIVNEQSISEFLLVTTTMPFFLTYTLTKPIVLLEEVDHELKLNALANILLNDSAFKYVQSIEAFKENAKSLLENRKEEVEEKKQWAKDLKNSRNI